MTQYARCILKPTKRTVLGLITALSAKGTVRPSTEAGLAPPRSVELAALAWAWDDLGNRL